MADIDVGKDVPASNGTPTAPDASDVLSALGSIAPADTTPADIAPADIAPADIAPADTTPTDTTPTDIPRADTTPADTGDTWAAAAAAGQESGAQLQPDSTSGDAPSITNIGVETSGESFKPG